MVPPVVPLMVRLVSSRVHRCYSRNGGQSSARNEQIADMAHVLGCLLFFLNHNSPFLSARIAPEISRDAGSLGWIMLLISNLSDLRASLTAHRMFYKWSKASKRNNRFFSTPTKVDAAVSVLCLFGGLLAVPNTLLSKYLNEKFEWSLAVWSAVLFCVGVITNLVASLPSLDFSVPSGLARLHNLVVAFFMVGSVLRLNTVILINIAEGLSLPSMFVRQFSFAADLLILLGASINYLRVRHLLENVHDWVIDDTRADGNKPPRGLLSWFKSSRSNKEMSDYDSDFEDNGPDSEDDTRGQTSKRCSRWSRV